MKDLDIERRFSKSEFNKSPLYLQIREVIYKKIINGEYKEGERVPSENELTKMFNVSRMTVSKALEELVNQNLLVKIQGKGTFVKHISKEGSGLDVSSLDFHGFSDSIVKKGLALTNIVYDSNLVIPSRKIMNELEINFAQKVFLLKRLRRVNNSPVVLQISYINSNYCEGIEEIDFESKSLYGVLRNKYALDFIKMNDKIEAIGADDEIANLLDVDIGFPILLLKRTTYIKNNIPIEFTYSYYRSDKHTLSIESEKVK